MRGFMSIALFVLYLSLCMCGAVGAGEGAGGEVQTFRMGGLELIAIQDAANEGAPNLLIGLSDENQRTYLTPGALKNSVNVFVAKMNDNTYLFDTGFGTDGNRAGKMLEGLAKAGIKPADIDAIFLTHFHGDHIGGLVSAGKPVFPEVLVFAAKAELDAGLAPNVTFPQVYGSLFSTFDFGTEVLPGVSAIEAAGHTPGHTAFRLEADGGKVLILGDLIHFSTVQLPLPRTAVTYDRDADKAVAARLRIFDQAAAERIPVAGMHLLFPGTGVLAKAGDGYALTPLQ